MPGSSFTTLLGIYGYQGKKMGSIPLLNTDRFLKIKTSTCESVRRMPEDATKAFSFYFLKKKSEMIYCVSGR